MKKILIALMLLTLLSLMGCNDKADEQKYVQVKDDMNAQFLLL